MIAPRSRLAQRGLAGAPALTGAGVCFGILPFIVNPLAASGVPVGAQVVVRLALASLVFALFDGTRSIGASRSAASAASDSTDADDAAAEPAAPRSRQFAYANAICLIAAFWTLTEALALGTPPAVAIALAYLYPIWWTMLVARFEHQAVGAREAAAIGLGIIGAGLTTQFWHETHQGGVLSLGGALAVVNGVLLAVMAYLGRTVRHRGITPWRFARGSFLPALVMATCAAIVLSVSDPGFIRPQLHRFEVTTVWLLLLQGVVCTAVSYLLLYAGASAATSSAAGIWLLSEPVTVVSGSALLRSGTLDVSVLAGLAAIIGSAALLRGSGEMPAAQA